MRFNRTARNNEQDWTPPAETVAAPGEVQHSNALNNAMGAYTNEPARNELATDDLAGNDLPSNDTISNDTASDDEIAASIGFGEHRARWDISGERGFVDVERRSDLDRDDAPANPGVLSLRTIQPVDLSPVETGPAHATPVHTSSVNPKQVHPQTEEPDMAASPTYYVPLNQAAAAVAESTIDKVEMSSAPTKPTPPAAPAPIALVGATAPVSSEMSSAVAGGSNTLHAEAILADDVELANGDQIDALVARLQTTRNKIDEGLSYCHSAAAEITNAVDTFTHSAAHMRGLADEQTELHELLGTAIDDLQSLRSNLDLQKQHAAAEATAMFEKTTANAETLRAEALADVERARERLMQFTAEISSVASDLRGRANH